jgi:hypothetical protein
MDKRVLLCLAAALFLVGGSLAFILLRDPINKANWDRITDGTTRPEVEHMLGKPGIDVPCCPGSSRPGWRLCQWTGRQEWIEVQFDAEGFARSTHWHNRSGSPGFLANLLAPGGLQWIFPHRSTRPERREAKHLHPTGDTSPPR